MQLPGRKGYEVLGFFSAVPRKLATPLGSVELSGFAGVVLGFRCCTVCVDVVEPRGCDFRFYTHGHPRHAPQEGLPGGAYAPFLGNVRAGDVLRLGGLTVRVVEAYNPGAGAPHPRGFGVGYVFELEGLAVYVAGDTSFVEEVLAAGGADVAVLPVGGGGVMSPEEAAEAVRSLRPVVTVPVHFEDPALYWKFKVLAQPYTQVVRLG